MLAAALNIVCGLLAPAPLPFLVAYSVRSVHMVAVCSTLIVLCVSIHCFVTVCLQRALAVFHSAAAHELEDVGSASAALHARLLRGAHGRAQIFGECFKIILC